MSTRPSLKQKFLNIITVLENTREPISSNKIYQENVGVHYKNIPEYIEIIKICQSKGPIHVQECQSPNRTYRAYKISENKKEEEK